MSLLRGFQRLKSVLCVQVNPGVRRVSAASAPVQRKDSLVKMENPYKKAKKGCVLCNIPVDFKNTQLLSQFVSPYTGRIYGRHITGLCGRKQKEVSKAIKKAHSMGFMSVTHKHPQFMKDPKICVVRRLY
ncbi:small ribosomal subunit protein bS18m [Stegastes partitus]|uniref:Small ribosomal subunit protein bS18m n=1 Tax=Stegastes partitus TaxID=144197 RepID=A0A3B4ZZI4_9TELE|nr:PREDICTED: 28S ribosomal protein S18c, mitochondrial [Stegastes partitus]